MKQRFSYIAFWVIVLAIATLSIVGILASHHSTPPLQGTVEAPEIRISGKLAGRVAEICVREGDNISEGDTLIVIHSPETEALHSQAVALEGAAIEQSNKVDEGARSEVIASAEQLWQGAKAQRTLAENTFHRVVRLWQDSIVSLQRKEEAEALYLSASAAERAAFEQYLLARKGAQKQDKESAHYMAAAAASSVSGVEAVLRDAHLRSPTNGIVAEIYPAEGELVGIGTPLLSIVDIAKPYAVFNVREDMMPRFKLGQRIRCDVPAIATPNIEWEICYIAPLGSYATWRSSHLAESYDMRTFEVHARPTKHVEGLYPGMSVLLTIENIEQ
ncbi:MAG: efflux RND transporter periplasmic adaptor subunit [Alistipes sp.]|nr:efflux RND transporter periplasmic adaptor subunit [Alistipes sp.]